MDGLLVFEYAVLIRMISDRFFRFAISCKVLCQAIGIQCR